MFEGLANFLQGKGWVSNTQLDEEEKKRNQAQAPVSSGNLTLGAPKTVASIQPGQIQTPQLVLQKPPQNAQPAAPAQQEPNFLERLGAGFQQAGGAVGDVLLQGGGFLTQLGAMTNPFKSQEERDKEVQQATDTVQQLRRDFQSQKDITGQNIVGTTDVDENARKIAFGQGNAEDYSKVLGKGFDVANTVTSVVPIGTGVQVGAKLAESGARAAAGNALRTASPLLKETAVLGSTATGADLLSGRGVTPESVAMNYGLPVAFGAGGAMVGAGIRSARNALFRQANDIEQTAMQTPTSQLGKIDDGISSETTAQVRRQEAQETANRIRQQADQIPDEQPQAPEVAAPDITRPETPFVLDRATPEQLLARDAAGDAEAAAEIQRRFDEAQAAVDADTVAPAPEAPTPNTEPISTPLESPVTQQSREVAAATPPVSPEAVRAAQNPVSEADLRLAANEAAESAGVPSGPVVNKNVSELTSYEGAPDRARVEEYKQRIANGEKLDPIIVMRDSQGNLGIEDGKHRFQAYQEMGVKDIPTVERGTGAQTDPRISQLYKEAEGHLKRADEILAREGSDVGQLGEKLYVADVNNTPAQLTPAEREAFDYLNSNINDAERVLLDQGIIDKDLGVRRDYLPTGDEASIEQVFTPEDINASTFNYARGRSGGFIKDDGTVSDKLPKGVRAAYADYYVRGKGSQYLSDSQVDDIKATRLVQEDMNDIMFGPSQEPMTNINGKPVKVETEQIRDNASKLVSLERNYAKAIKSGDERAIQQAQKEVNQKTIDNSVAKLTQMKKQVDDLIAETKASTLPREQKTARIVELENRLEYARKQASYQQSYVKTNLLFQVPGRVADQVGKLTQSIGEAITAPLASRATSGFRPGTKAGRQAARTVASDANLNARSNNYRLNKQLNKATANNGLQKATGAYTALGTRVTELGSRQKAPTLDTARYFAAQAEAQGVENVTDYIRKAVGTKEWERVFNQFNAARNRYSGVGDITGSTVREGAGLRKGAVNQFLDNAKSLLNNSLDKAFATSLPRSVRRNMADAISIPLIGFPRVVWNVGAKGMDYATFGLSNLYKASRINVVDDATALQKALVLRDAIDGAAAGTGLVGLGVLLGQTDMVTGSEPEKQANGEWVPPYSIKLGNDYVELGRFIGPYAVPIMLAAAISRGDSAANIASIPALVASQVLNNFGADSIGDTMSQIGDALNGDYSGLSKKIPNMLAAFAPFSGQINSIANATDPYQRETKNDDGFVQFMQQLAAKVPGLRQQLDVKTDQFGNDIPNSPFKALVPLSTVGSDWGESELGAEANRLELTPSGNSNTQGNAEEMAGRLIKSGWYKGLDDEAKKDALQSALYSEKLGEINDKLSDTAKNALTVGTLMEPDEREKWLEDAATARDYHVANYENAVENDTLTAKDNSLQNSSSLHYKAVASQVNATLPYWTAELEELYKETSKTELYAMSPENPIRKKLLALDAARTSAGVSLKSSDHSAAKYGDGSGSGGSGRGGRGGISLVSGEAVTAGKSGFSQPVSTPGFNTKLVKPQGIGDASEKVKRKITVKRGVQL